MSKKEDKIKDDDVSKVIIDELTEEERSKILEPREVYPTGFRNLDTLIGYRVYDTDGSVRTLNRGVLSGSWIVLTGVPHSGKSTLGLQIIASMMKKFINPNNPDDRVALHIIDVESGVNNERLKLLTGLSDRQIYKHVNWVEDATLQGFEKLVANIVQEKSDKAYKPDKRVGSQGYMIDIYPPTFIFVDAISELVSNAIVDPGLDPEKIKMVHMNQGMLMDLFVKRFKHAFVKYNINILTISHLSDKIDMNAMPGARPAREYLGLDSGKKINGGKALQYATDIGININKIIAKDAKSVEAKGGKNLDASSISQATLFKNRQGLAGKPFFLVYDSKGKFDQLGSFLYECQQNKVIVSAGAIKKIDGTEYSCRSGDVADKFIQDEGFRTALLNRYDLEYEEQLDSVKNTEEERQRTNDILDLLMD